MSYTAKITRENPTALLFLLDQSGSMKGNLGRDKKVRKADSAADAINQIITEFVIQSTKEGGVRNYMYIGVIGYADDVKPILGGALRGLEMVPIKEIADNFLRIDERIVIRRKNDGAGGLIEHTVKLKSRIWVDPVANGNTVMCRALDYAYQILSVWIGTHPTCFPPIVINISDGEPKDGDPASNAEKIKALSTTDGNVLLFNFHISSKPQGELLFPSEISQVRDKYANRLFSMSSLLTEGMVSTAQSSGLDVAQGSRGFGYCVNNSDMLVKIMQVGSQSSRKHNDA